MDIASIYSLFGNRAIYSLSYQNITDNYVLRGNQENSRYALISPIQIEKGPRLLFPHFGFHYRAKNTRVKVIFIETSSNTQHDIMNSMVNTLNDEIESENEWRYFFKNITEESFISTAWSGTSEVEWQVTRFLNMNMMRLIFIYQFSYLYF